jgi:hypothetical protein
MSCVIIVNISDFDFCIAAKKMNSFIKSSSIVAGKI